MDNSFKKSERLNSKKGISILFEKGKSLFSHPYRAVWIKTEEIQDEVPVQIMISVSKRNFKKAVDRNKIKRYMREAYRIQKSIIWDAQQDKQYQLQFGLMYIDKEIRDFDFHQKAMERVLKKLSKEISNK